jgi:glycine cleavage system H protein
VGRKVKKGEGAAVVESVKAASDVYSPLSGEVTETNTSLVDSPSNVNEAAEEGGWFMKVKIADKSELEGLLDGAAYKDFLKDL